MPCKTLAILLAGLAYKKDNGYLYGIIDVSGVVHPHTQFNDALIESQGIFHCSLPLGGDGLPSYAPIGRLAK